MSAYDSDHKILVNDVAVETLCADGWDYFTAFPITTRTVSIVLVELRDPDGEIVACFRFAQAFAVPKGEQGILNIWKDDAGHYVMRYQACKSPDCLAERGDMYQWDAGESRLRAASH